jgi:hypothetical protein
MDSITINLSEKDGRLVVTTDPAGFEAAVDVVNGVYVVASNSVYRAVTGQLLECRFGRLLTKDEEERIVAAQAA